MAALQGGLALVEVQVLETEDVRGLRHYPTVRERPMPVRLRRHMEDDSL